MERMENWTRFKWLKQGHFLCMVKLIMLIFSMNKQFVKAVNAIYEKTNHTFHSHCLKSILQIFKYI